MEELILKIIEEISKRRATDHKWPPGCDAITIKTEFNNLVTEVLDDMESRGVISSYPTVNGTKVYTSIRTIAP